MRHILILPLLFICTAASAESYFVGPWVAIECPQVAQGATSCWGPPKGAAQGLDLRSNDEQDTAGEGVFVSDAFSISGYEKLTQVEAESLAWDTLTRDSDPEGKLTPKPLMPGKDGVLRLQLGDIRKEEKLDFDSPFGEKVKAVMRADFEKMPEEEGRRFLGATVLELGINPVPEVSPTDPHTTINENFNCTDSLSLNCQLTWTKITNSTGDIAIVSNAAKPVVTASTGYERAESNLSSDNHYAQVVVSNWPLAVGYIDAYVMARTSSASTAVADLTTYYAGFYRDLTTNDYFISKYVSGSYTEIRRSSQTISTNDVIKLELNGSSITLYLNGGVIYSTTDTSITGNLRTGIVGTNQNSLDDVRMDSFEASDGLSTIKDPVRII